VTGAAQFGEDVELPRLQVVGGEDRTARTVEVAGQPRDPAQDLQRRYVKIGTFGAPRLD